MVTFENVTTPFFMPTLPDETSNVDKTEPVFAHDRGHRGSFHSLIKIDTVGSTILFPCAIPASYWNTLEAADVMYFAMVAAVKGGADLEAIERHLNARTLKIKRRPGNSKPERIAAAAAELDAIRAKKKRKVGGE